MADLATILDGLNKEVLIAHAPLVGAGVHGRKGEIVNGIAARIRSSPKRLVNACGRDEKLLLAELAHGSELGITPARFTAKHAVPFPKMERWGGYRRRQGSVLVLVTDHDCDEGVYGLASDLRTPLRQLLPPPPGASVRTVAELPGEHVSTRWGATLTKAVRIYEGAAHAFEEGRRVLALVQQGKVRVSASTKRPAAAAVEAVGSVLLTPDLDLEDPDGAEETGPVRAYAWPVVVQQCGWAKAQGAKLALTRKGVALLTSPSPELWREGFERLLVDRVFDELHRVPNIRGQTGRGKRTRTPTAERRAEIADAMAEWPIGEWLAFEDAFRLGIASGHDFTVNRCPWNLYFCEHGYGSLNDGHHHDLARQYLRVLLLETFATLGIVDAAYVPPHYLWPELGDSWGIDEIPFCSRCDGLLYARLTPLGAFCLGVSDHYEAPGAEGVRLRVLANRDVVGLDQPQLPPAVSGLLEMYAKRRADAVWRLDEKLIVAHLERGGSTRDVRELLARHGVASLPETVESFLADIDRRAMAVAGVEDALVVRFRDPATAALIANDAAGRKLCLAAGQEAVAVPKKNEEAFRALLRRKGYPLTF